MQFSGNKHFWHDLRRKAFAITHRKRARRFARLRRRMKYDGYSLIPCDRRHAIFVRIPKCATQAIARSLFGNLAGGHLTIEDYRHVYPAAEFYSYYKFGVVRNPWDRLVSAYFFLKKGGVNAYDQNWAVAHIAPYRDFEDFVQQWLTPENAGASLHFKPQHDFLCFGNGKLGVDFIAHYENLAHDYDVIARHLGADSRLQSVNRSTNRARDYRRYFTSDMVDVVCRVYAKDIELFGYRFDPAAMAGLGGAGGPAN